MMTSRYAVHSHQHGTRRLLVALGFAIARLFPTPGAMGYARGSSSTMIEESETEVVSMLEIESVWVPPWEWNPNVPTPKKLRALQRAAAANKKKMPVVSQHMGPIREQVGIADGDETRSSTRAGAGEAEVEQSTGVAPSSTTYSGKMNNKNNNVTVDELRERYRLFSEDRLNSGAAPEGEAGASSSSGRAALSREPFQTPELRSADEVGYIDGISESNRDLLRAYPYGELVLSAPASISGQERSFAYNYNSGANSTALWLGFRRAQYHLTFGLRFVLNAGSCCGSLHGFRRFAIVFLACMILLSAWYWLWIRRRFSGRSGRSSCAGGGGSCSHENQHEQQDEMKQEHRWGRAGPWTKLSRLWRQVITRRADWGGNGGKDAELRL